MKRLWDIFNQSLDAAIRDIEDHPRGKLFRRLIEFGPHNPSESEILIDNKETTLSDSECGSCLEFIFSFMINRFKGELAELLALDPCIKLVQQLQQNGSLPSGNQFFWGDAIQERRKLRKDNDVEMGWGNFTKGADALLVKQEKSPESKSQNRLKILGVFEVKSMMVSKRKVITQINRHVTRLYGGVKLAEKEWSSYNLNIPPCGTTEKDESDLLRVMIMPSIWKLSRNWFSVETEWGRSMEFPKPSDPPVQSEMIELEPNLWKIKLAWSQEALNQAAYEMTFWYMSQVGKRVYHTKKMPKDWENKTPEQAGYNAIKMMLYYILMSCSTKRHKRLATRLYNVYSFGYPLGVDSKVMLWPEDFPYEDEK